MSSTSIKTHMATALNLASTASEHFDEVPVGAVITKNGKIIAQAHNLKETNRNCLDHAEILAIKQACLALGSWRLNDCEMYVTLEPCTMCAGAIVQSRLKALYYGAYDPKTGACKSLYQVTTDARLNHQVQTTGGILEQECGDLLKTFFKNKRTQKKAKVKNDLL